MKNTEFVQKAKEALNYKTIYAWGGFGNRATLSRINQFSARYPSYYSSGLINYLKANQDGYMVDCCGLIKSVFMGCIPNVEYQSKYDRDSDGITIGNATEAGSINTLPEIPGILLQMEGHCGIYLGDGKVLESTPNEAIAKRKYGGVCISNLSDRKWLKWAKSKWIEYEEEQVTPTSKIDVIYQAYDNVLKKFLAEIKNYNTVNTNGYAGWLGHSLGGLRVKASKGTITVQSHIKGGSWLSPITKWDDTNSGYSGLYGKELDMIMIKSSEGTARYRVHIKNGNWLDWVTKFDINDSVNGMAGIYGKAIDCIQIEII